MQSPALKFKKTFAQEHNGDLVIGQKLILVSSSLIMQLLLPFISTALRNLESPFTYQSQGSD